MLENVNRALLARLRAQRVQVDAPDADTLVLRHVPIHPDFSKPHTNLLLMRTGKTRQPCIVCVDEDLSYRGADPRLAHTFAAGPRRSGWRVLSMNPAVARRPEATLDASLAALGFCGGAPCPDGLDLAERQPEAPRLRKFAQDLTARVRAGEGAATVGRTEEIEQLAGCVCCWGPARLGLVLGEPGVGKTNLLHGLAAFLAERRPDLHLLRVDLVEVLAGAQAEGERQLAVLDLLNEARGQPGTILAMERLDYLLASGEPVEGLVSRALDSGLRLVGTALPGTLPWPKLPQLWRRTQVVRLSEPEPGEVSAILLAWKSQIEAHHGVQVADHVLALAARLALDLPGRLPAKALGLLDQAVSTAALLKAPVVSPDDLAAAKRGLAAKRPEDDGGEPAEGE